MNDLTYLRTFGCLAAGCADYAEYGRHAPNCVQAEFDVVLDEVLRLRGRNMLLRHALMFCRDKLEVMVEEGEASDGDHAMLYVANEVLSATTPEDTHE